MNGEDFESTDDVRLLFLFCFLPFPGEFDEGDGTQDQAIDAGDDTAVGVLKDR